MSAGDGFDTPIALLTFNRPHLTKRLVEILAQVKPRRVFVVSDGPRPHVAGDVENCAAVRRLFEKLDWECEIERDFAERNMGSFPRNASGLNWVFDQVEEAIILEDDCVPSLSFFPYCEALLKKYRDNPRVGVISGNNFLKPGTGEQTASYFFSRYATTWGWASWRRTWRQVDLEMPYWLEFRDSGKLRQSVFSSSEENYWRGIYDRIHQRTRKNAWDYQLMLACRRFDLLTVVPSVNLVSNAGYGPDATHCINPNNLACDVAAHELRFPLIHPEKTEASPEIDYRIFRQRFHEYWWFRKTKRVPGLFKLLKALFA
ncbi:MAG: hypothetical protein K2Q17_00660 [Nitrospiraceae bacterium]|jgi:hypothetical protein|nr:hypothetical protein [Nitrospiraceae bacterium]